MRCLNSPPVLNALEAKIIEGVPAETRHVLVINAGDGRLARALADKLKKQAVVSVVSIHPSLQRWLDEFAGHTSDPWDLAWHSAQVARHGGYDYVVFYQLQEYWHGELYQLERIVRLAKPGATIWTTFVNAQSYRMIARFLPPARLGYSNLADPVRGAPNIDFGSFLDFAGRHGGAITELWGMLDKNALEYCQKAPAKPVKWELRGVKVSVGSMADAYLWGASVVGGAFTVAGGTGKAIRPKISYSPYNTNLLQALVLPYPDEQAKEAVLTAALFEMDAWRKGPEPKLGTVSKLLFKQVENADQPKRVLLMGSGWGRDLLLLKREYPAWELVGCDHQQELVALGKDFVETAGVTVVSAELGTALPFPDRSFDLVVSLGYFSGLYEPAARHLAQEARRVAKGAIYHLEDGRGPEHGMQLKSYSLKVVYASIGAPTAVKPLMIEGKANGMYILRVAAPA